MSDQHDMAALMRAAADDPATFAPRRDRGIKLWASGDICAHFRVSRTTLQRWRIWPDFPAPRWRISRGTVDVWDAADVKRWHEQARMDGRVKS